MFFTKVYSALLVFVVGAIVPGNPSKATKNNLSPEKIESFVAHCTPQGMLPWNDYISGFKLADLDHLNQGTDAKPVAAPVGYRDYSTMLANVTTGSTYPIDFNVVTDYWGPYPMDINVRIWIDKDEDDIFDPVTELVYSNTVTLNSGDSGAGQTFNAGGNLTIPSDANLGTLRMRIASAQSAIPVPCGAAFKGEVEDYGLVVTNGGGGNPPTVVLNPSNPTGGAPNSGSVAAQVTGGVTPYTYLWSAGNPNDQSVITNLAVGTYTVTVTGGDGASTVESATLTCPDTGQSCDDGDPNTINDTVDANCACTGTPAGGGGCTFYSLTNAVVSNAAGSSPTGNADLIVSHQPTVFPPTSAPSNTDAWTWGGEPELAVYIDLGSSESVGGIAIHKQTWGTDSIIIKAASWSTSTNSFTDGATLASFDLNAGGSTNDWYTETLANSVTTSYLKVERSSNGAQITEVAICTGSSTPPLALTHTQVDPSSTSSNDGSIDLTVTGGTTPYTYAWSDGGSNTQDRFNLGEGTYTVTVTDQTGTTVTSNIQLTAPVGNPGSQISVNNCPASQELVVAAGDSTIIANWSAPTGTTDCATGPSVTVNQTAGLTSGSSFPIGASLITYELTDTCGSTVTCSFTITVADACAPQGTPCNDGNMLTINDEEDGNCNCVGELIGGGGDCSNPLNLALNQPAAQNSVLDDPRGIAANAVNGVTTGIYWAGPPYAIAHTQWVSGEQQWWEVDLGAQVQIEEIRIQGSTDLSSNNMSNFSVFVSTDPFPTNTPVTTIQGLSTTVFTYNHTATLTGQFSSVPNVNSTGRYVRIQRNTEGFVILGEVEVMGCQGGGSTLTSGFNWDTISTNLTIEGDSLFRKQFASPFEYLKVDKTLSPNQNGSFQVELLEDVKTNGDWFYIGLVELGTPIDLSGSWSPLIGAGIRADQYAAGQNFVAINLGDTSMTAVGGLQGDIIKVERNGQTVSASLNGTVVGQYQNSAYANQTLQPIIYFNKPGTDQRFKFLPSIDGAFQDGPLKLSYTKTNAGVDTPGQISLDIRGGQAPYTALVNDAIPVVSNTIDSLSPGVYKLKVFDANNNVDSAYVTIKQQVPMQWDELPPTLSITNNTYTYSGNNSGVLLQGGYPIAANGESSIFIRLDEDLTAPEKFNLYFKDTTTRADNKGIYGLAFNDFGVEALTDSLVGSSDPKYSNIAGVRSTETQWVLSNYEYEIRLSDRKVYVFKNFRLIYELEVDVDIDMLIPEIQFFDSGVDGLDLTINVSSNGEEEANQNLRYAELKSKLDGTFTMAYCDKLHIKYIQEYAIETGLNESLEFKAYDWQGNEVSTWNPEVPLQFGTNWITLEFKNLGSNQFYTLEVTGNKKKKYYLRFKSKFTRDCIKTSSEIPENEQENTGIVIAEFP